MNRATLITQIKQKQSFLCVGLDTDINKIPAHLKKEPDPIFAFNKAIIDATKEYAVAYKPNTAFYEAMGVKGWEALKETVDYIPKDCFIIADAKRGDIGNTAQLYAKAFFGNLDVNALTVAPYMGRDSVKPFLEFKDKWVILLALTSNEGAMDFQFLDIAQTHQPLYQKVIQKAEQWGTPENMMFVVGATRPEMLKEVRAIAPEHFLLVPGVGAQGGNLSEVCKYGLNKDCGLLVNASRSIIYAGNDEDFAMKAAEKASELQQQMQHLLKEKVII